MSGVRGKIPLQVGVTDARRAVLAQCESYLQNDVAPALRRIEQAGAIGEAALGVGERLDLERLQVERPHFDDGLGNFLPVRTHVLHRSSAHRAGNSAKTFQPGTIGIDGLRDQRVPIATRSGSEGRVTTGKVGDCDFQDEVGEARARRRPRCCRRQAQIAADYAIAQKWTASRTSASVVASAK